MGAELHDAAHAGRDVSLQLMDALHHRWVVLLRRLSDADFSRTFRHPEIGSVRPGLPTSPCTPGTAATTWRTSPAYGNEWAGNSQNRKP